MAAAARGRSAADDSDEEDWEANYESPNSADLMSSDDDEVETVAEAEVLMMSGSPPSDVGSPPQLWTQTTPGERRPRRSPRQSSPPKKKRKVTLSPTTNETKKHRGKNDTQMDSLARMALPAENRSKTSKKPSPLKSQDPNAQVIDISASPARTGKNNKSSTSKVCDETKLKAINAEKNGGKEKRRKMQSQVVESSKESTETKEASKTPATKKEDKKTKAGTDKSIPLAKKPKKKKLTFEQQLLRHMFLSAKPFSMKQLCEDMKSGEAAVNFCLLSCIDKQTVVKKEFAGKKSGRTKELFWANQAMLDKSTSLAEALQLANTREIHEIAQERKHVTAQLATVQSVLANVVKAPSNVELDLQIASLQKEVDGLLDRRNETIARCQQNSQKGSNGKTTKLKLYKKINHMRMEWKNRKNKCMDFVDQLADAMEKKLKQVVQLLELETDEAVGVKIPPKYEA